MTSLPAKDNSEVLRSLTPSQRRLSLKQKGLGHFGLFTLKRVTLQRMGKG